jgi:hypothetical protein
MLCLQNNPQIESAGAHPKELAIRGLQILERGICRAYSLTPATAGRSLPLNRQNRFYSKEIFIIPSARRRYAG